ncbi:MAG: pilus assembly protein PilM [Phycisphaerales bacterium]|nr:pilus assembly protein PilM [Phycisphaerales bacterium]
MGISLKTLSALGSARLMSGSGSPIAFEFGTSELKVLQITTGPNPHLVAAAALEMPPRLRRDAQARLAFQIEALPKLVKAGGFKGKRAVCSMPSAMSFCKHLRIVKADGVSLETLVRAKLQSTMGCDPNALVYRWVPVEGGAGSRDEVICMGAGREVIQRLMRGLKAAKLEPVAMHSDFQAILTAMHACTRHLDDHEDKPTLYLELGAGGSRVLVGDGERLAFAKFVEIGGRHLDEAIAREQNIDLERARHIRLDLETLVPETADAASVEAVEAAAEDSGSGSGLAMLEAALKRSRARPNNEDNGGSAVMAALDESAMGMETLDEAMSRTGTDLSEPLEILTDEVQMCVRYYNGMCPQRRIERVVFLGGECRQMALCTHIAKRLNLPAQIADPLARVTRTGNEPCIGTDLSGSQPGWAVALGLCLRPTDL